MSFDPIFDYIKIDSFDKIKKSKLLITNKCPKCESENSLIIMYQKDRYVRGQHIYSTMKIECLQPKCKWKVSGNYKWKQHST